VGVELDGLIFSHEPLSAGEWWPGSKLCLVPNACLTALTVACPRVHRTVWRDEVGVLDSAVVCVFYWHNLSHTLKCFLHLLLSSKALGGYCDLPSSALSMGGSIRMSTHFWSESSLSQCGLPYWRLSVKSCHEWPM